MKEVRIITRNKIVVENGSLGGRTTNLISQILVYRFLVEEWPR